MIKIENVEVMGWEHAIRGMRNPKNSWDRIDSYGVKEEIVGITTEDYPDGLPPFIIGPNDHKLMTQLAAGGAVHAKYRRMITVYLDITAPLYWWKEFDTYKVGTVANSCSTMHKIHEKEFTLEDFSCEHLMNYEEVGAGVLTKPNDVPLYVLKNVIECLNAHRKAFIVASKEHNQFDAVKAKDYWWQMIQLLPSSYNQKRTIMLNYEVLTNIYESRRFHKLDEWRTLCEWIESLPYSEIITGKDFAEFMNEPQEEKKDE